MLHDLLCRDRLHHAFFSGRYLIYKQRWRQSLAHIISSGVRYHQVFFSTGKRYVKQPARHLGFVALFRIVFCFGNGIGQPVFITAASFIFPEILGSPYQEYIFKLITLGTMRGIEVHTIFILYHPLQRQRYVLIVHPRYHLQQLGRLYPCVACMRVFYKFKERIQHLYTPYMICCSYQVCHYATLMHYLFYKQR